MLSDYHATPWYHPEDEPVFAAPSLCDGVELEAGYLLPQQLFPAERPISQSLTTVQGWLLGWLGRR